MKPSEEFRQGETPETEVESIQIAIRERAEATPSGDRPAGEKAE